MQVRVGDIAGQADYPLGAQFIYPRAQAICVDIGEQQVAALAVIGARKLPAEAAGGPGDQDGGHYFSPALARAAGVSGRLAGGRRDQIKARIRPLTRCQQPQNAAINSMPLACGKKVKMITRPRAEF